MMIGIDLGGTNVRAGAVTPEGDLVFWRGVEINAARGPENGIKTITRLVDKVVRQMDRPLIGIGIGSTGPLDLTRGCIQNPYTLPGWEDVDIVTPLRERFGVPVALENDADAAALGESWRGAGQGVRRLVMITVGTGVGYALILDGQIYRGLHSSHPEGGHIPIDPSGPVCYCGARGCLESLVSGPAIAQSVRTHSALSGSEIYRLVAGDPTRIEAAHIFQSARRGDAFAGQIVAQTAEYLGLGLVAILMLLTPDCIVLTGGVLRSFDLLEPGMRAVIDRHNVIIPAREVKIRLAELGQQAGVIGAARAAQLLAHSPQISEN